MKRKSDLRAVCAEVHEDDCVDPRLAFSRRAKRESSGDRKVQQLCKQAARAIGLALQECGDERLREVEVVDVQPAPDSSRLAVIARRISSSRADASGGPGCAGTDSLLAGLQQASGFLRAQLAAAITRKRVPELTFRVVGSEEVRP